MAQGGAQLPSKVAGQESTTCLCGRAVEQEDAQKARDKAREVGSTLGEVAGNTKDFLEYKVNPPPAPRKKVLGALPPAPRPPSPPLPFSHTDIASQSPPPSRFCVRFAPAVTPGSLGAWCTDHQARRPRAPCRCASACGICHAAAAGSFSWSGLHVKGCAALVGVSVCTLCLLLKYACPYTFLLCL